MGKKEALQALGPRLVLPSPPDVVVRINAMIADRSCGPQEIGRVVGGDPALAVRVVSTANSSFYGLQEPVLSAEQAATVIGVRSLRNIAMQASIAQRYEHLEGRDELDVRDLWEHSERCAQLSQLLGAASRLDLDLAPDEFYTCGLLHDIGKVALLESLREEYLDVLREARSERVPLHHSEQQLLGFTHVDVGALVAARWKLPPAVALSIAYHHGPTPRILEYPAVAVVAVADQLAYRADLVDFEIAGRKLADLAEHVLAVTPAAFQRVVEAARGGRQALRAA
ncbi:MAG TPA: HDOD domain-containing protein [Planctomycetota bacterium]|nr:HDOD domain-containing protein [Planctomycetota bacterium]